MNKEQILEYNKKCAEFLGYSYDDMSETYETPHLKLVEPQAFGDEQFSCKLKDYELDFHKDWNWIMEVVEAINKTKNPKQGGDTTHSTLKREVQTLLGKVAKESAVQAINQFLTWYSANK